MGAGAWKSLGEFLCQPYWSRLWIIQEIAMSHDSLNVLYGDRIIAWPLLNRIIDLFASDPQALSRKIRLEREMTGLWDNTESLLKGLGLIQCLSTLSNVVNDSSRRPSLQYILMLARNAKQHDPETRYMEYWA